MSAHDESPRVSAAVGREDAVRHHLAPTSCPGDALWAVSLNCVLCRTPTLYNVELGPYGHIRNGVRGETVGR